MSFTSSRDLRIAIGARALGVLGDTLASVTLMLRIQEQGHGSMTAAALLLCGMAPMALFGPLAGRLVDRADSRTLLLVTLTLQTVACLALVAATALPLVLGLVFVIGLGEAVAATTWQVLVAEIAGRDGLSRALGWSQSTSAVALVAGPALAGVLTGALGTRTPLLVDAASFALVGLGAALIRTRRRPDVADKPDEQIEPRFRVMRDPVLRALVIMLGVFITAGAAVNVIEVFLVRDTLHASTTWFGVCAAAWAVGMIAGGPVAGRLATPGRLARGVVGSSSLLGLGLALMGLAPNAPVLALFSLVGGFANGFVNVTSSSTVLLRAPESVRGQVSGTVSAVANGGQVGAYVLGGVLGTLVDLRAIFIAAGLASLVAVVVFAAPLLRATGAREPALV